MISFQDKAGKYHVEAFVPLLSESLAFNPASVAQEIEKRSKYAAKLLSSVAEISHRRSLEVISIGLGFKSWYGFKADLASVTESSPAPDEWQNRMSNAFLLLGCNQEDVQIPDAHLKGIERIAEIISSITARSTSVLLDDVFSRLCSGGSWNEIVNRRPTNATKPLYGFSTQWGSYTLSPACTQMIEELHSFLYENHDAKRSDTTVVRHLRSLIEAQPTFASAALELALYHLEIGQPEEAYWVAIEPAKNLLGLIPKDYKGCLSYWSHENRPLLRLLLAQAKAKTALGEYFEALEIAETLLILAPEDGINVRQLISALLKALNKKDLASKWARQSKKPAFYHLSILDHRYLTELVSKGEI